MSAVEANGRAQESESSRPGDMERKLPTTPVDFWAAFDSRLQDAWAAITEHGLQQNVAELEALGYTVLDPQARPGVVERMRESIFNAAEKHWGPGARDGSYFEKAPRQSTSIIDADIEGEPAFVEAITNPRVVALVRYLLGHNARYSSSGAFYKARGERTGLHTDSYGLPVPMPEWDVVCPVAWLLTDVRSAEDGALSFVPGSHRLRYHPTPADDALAGQRAVPVLADAGSVIVFRGPTWHCTPAKQTPGIRAHVRFSYYRYLGGLLDRGEVSIPDNFIASIPETTRNVLLGYPRLADLWESVKKDGVSETTRGPDDPARRALKEFAHRFRGEGSQYV